jgi:hypothetical protein
MTTPDLTRLLVSIANVSDAQRMYDAPKEEGEAATAELFSQ